MENEYKKDYGFKDASIVYIMAILVPLIISFFIGVVLAIFSTLLGLKAETLTGNIFVYSVLLLISQGSLFLVAFLYSKHNKINIYSATKLNNKINIWQILVLILIALASLFLLLPFINFTDSVIRYFGYNNSSELPFVVNSWWKYIIALLVMGFLPAFCEETVFRGVIYNGIKNKHGAKKAVVISALCFCIMHMSLQQMFYPLILGVVLALIVYYTNSLRASIFVHFLNNAIVITSNFIASFSGSTEAEATKLTWQNGLIAFVCLIGAGLIIFGLLMLLRYIKQKQNNVSIQTLNTTEEKDKQNTQEVINEENLQQNIEATKQSNIENDKKEVNMFIIFIVISVVLWVIENAIYFK